MRNKIIILSSWSVSLYSPGRVVCRGRIHQIACILDIGNNNNNIIIVFFFHCFLVTRSFDVPTFLYNLGDRLFICAFKSTSTEDRPIVKRFFPSILITARGRLFIYSFFFFFNYRLRRRPGMTHERRRKTVSLKPKDRINTRI